MHVHVHVHITYIYWPHHDSVFNVYVLLFLISWTFFHFFLLVCFTHTYTCMYMYICISMYPPPLKKCRSAQGWAPGVMYILILCLFVCLYCSGIVWIPFLLFFYNYLSYVVCVLYTCIAHMYCHVHVNVHVYNCIEERKQNGFSCDNTRV